MMNTFATTILRESDDTIDTDSWHVKESRKKKSARGGENHVSGDDATSTSATPHRTNVTEPWDEDDEDAYYYSHAYGDDDDFDSETQSSFYSGGSESITKAISPSTITFITPTHEHELSKSSRAVNRKNIRLATKHQRNVKTIRTNQKTRAENLENRERRKNPHVPGLCSHSN
ncbi:hypothetical protein BGZ73_005856 [Actinomortierella ambigua]|nr:hypothetical protein BGZ73_005856 [Actinomortierella ambigua]